MSKGHLTNLHHCLHNASLRLCVAMATVYKAMVFKHSSHVSPPSLANTHHQCVICSITNMLSVIDLQLASMTQTFATIGDAFSYELLTYSHTLVIVGVCTVPGRLILFCYKCIFTVL